MSFMWFFEELEGVQEDQRTHVTSSLVRRKRMRDHSNPLEMDEDLFKTNYRLSKDVFLILLDEIEPKIRGHTRSSIPSILKLTCLLRFCAQGSYQMSVGNDFNVGIGRSTVSETLQEMLNIFENHICPKWILFNYSTEEEEEAKAFFYEKSRIPGIIGCIDGTHIRIRCHDRNLKNLYYNRKGYFSLNAMIVCNHKMVIKYINAKYPGASHDSLVWNLSRLKVILEEKFNNGMRNTWLLGDAGYPLCPYLITPFRNTEENSREARFNTQHCKARVKIENTIGLLKNRFRCLLGARALHYKPEKATKIINVCAALHNICLHHNIEFDFIENNYAQWDGEFEINDDQNSEGAAIRNTLLNLLD